MKNIFWLLGTGLISWIFFASLLISPLQAQTEAIDSSRIVQPVNKDKKIVPAVNKEKKTVPPVDKNKDRVVPATNQAKKSAQQPGNVNLIVNGSIDALVQKNRYLNEQNPYIEGWRIQIIQATNKTKVLNLRADIVNQYPTLAVYYKYEQPYFKLRVGDFKSRLDAYRMFIRIKKEFSSAFIVRQRINLSRL